MQTMDLSPQAGSTDCWVCDTPVPTETYSSLEVTKHVVQQYARANGFALVVKRSKAWGNPPTTKRVLMQCAQGGLFKQTSLLSNLREKGSRKVGCTYELLLSCNSDGRWFIEPKNSTHSNHPQRAGTLSGIAHARRATQTPEIIAQVEAMHKNGCTPRAICRTLSSNDVLLSRRDVENIVQKRKREQMEGKTPIEMLMALLKGERVLSAAKLDDENRVTHLFLDGVRISETCGADRVCLIHSLKSPTTHQDGMAGVAKRLGQLLPQSSVLFVCDVQEVFRGLTFQMPTVIHSTNTMVSAAKLLKLPVVVTTQYGSRLGCTVAEISEHLKSVSDVKIFDKMKFSMLVPEVEHHLTTNMPQRNSVILCGIETHVCILQTCLDLLDKGFDVHVISDAVSSSTGYNRNLALERMRQSGAFITSVESAIFQLVNDASHPEFKSISKLIKEHLKTKNGFDAAVRI